MIATEWKNGRFSYCRRAGAYGILCGQSYAPFVFLNKVV
ncbi:Hypothetical protein Cp226_0420 [Corynebacterium pseudotuberculosis]|nr:Hypothetical protein Cp226_0420 [Corynebacterium pseudotuberculosis]